MLRYGIMKLVLYLPASTSCDVLRYIDTVRRGNTNRAGFPAKFPTGVAGVSYVLHAFTYTQTEKEREREREMNTQQGKV